MRCALILLGLLASAGLAGCGQSGPSRSDYGWSPRSAPRPRSTAGSPVTAMPAEMPARAAASPTVAEMASEPSVVADAAGKAEVRIDMTLRPAKPAELPRAAEPSRRAEMKPHRARPLDPPAGLDRNIQSGTLTAGSFDDVLHVDDYRQFVETAVAQDRRESLPRLAIGCHAMIEVVTPQGMPVGGARVTVRAAGNQQPGPVLATLTTGSDGRTVFFPEIDGGAGGWEYLVSAQCDGSAQEQFVEIDQGPWRVELSGVQPELPRRLDLALVVDTTGSMGDELEYLKVEIDSIAQAIYRMFPQVDQRYALVLYRDAGDEYVVRPFDFTASLAEFRAGLAEQSAGGGGDEPEAVHLAMEQAAQLDWRGGNTARVLFHVADAPPHAAYGEQMLAAVNRLRAGGVRIYPVASSGVGTHAEFTMRASAFLTLGQYLFLTDHSGVGNPHAAPHVPQYAVERLDRMMVRMIASELAGRRLAADEILAIESGRQIAPESLAPLTRCIRPAPSRTAFAAPRSSPPRAETGGWMRYPWLVLAVLVGGALLLDYCVREGNL